MSRSTMNARDVFLCQSSGDAEVARQLRTVLEAAGYSCWMAPDDIVGTETWTEQILAAIDGSRAMLVLVSANANRSPHVSREVNLALARRRAVLPIRIESIAAEGSLEHLLSLVQRVDAFPPPLTDHADRITKRLDELLRPDATPPPPPPPPTMAAETMEAETKLARRTGRRRPAVATPRGTGPIGPGDVIAAFTIESLLGEGGMATVYRARQEEPRRLVALKVIRANHAANETYRQRFLTEKETLAALEHPVIVPIYAAGDADGVLYSAMRLVDGPDLQARITRQGRLSLRETVQILEPIADAVDYAHSVGVIHRALKPSNIILDRAGRPYLTDFGLGKRLEVDTSVGVPGLAIGTLDFMAPEQFTGPTDSELAPAIDLYALGCVAYACLMGQPPFVRSTPEQLMYAHAHETPPPIWSIRPEYPPVIDEIFSRILAKDPAERYGSAREFVSALESIVQSASAGLTMPVVIPQQVAPAAQARKWVGRLFGRHAQPEAPFPAHRGSLSESGSMEPTTVRERSTLDERGEGDRVECSVHAPPSVLSGSQFLVQAWIHLLDHADEVSRTAQELDAAARLRAFRTLEFRIRSGARVTIELRLPGGIVDDPWQTLVWTGRPQVATFGVLLPEGMTVPASLIGTVSVFLDDVPLGHLKFTVAVGLWTAPGDTLKAAARAAARYERAFVSYASADRAKVLPRIQMLPALGIQFFQDILSLEPGERWEPELFRQIDSCDLFLLFWSERARTSDWVRKEVIHAISRKAGDDARPPEIRPVIIEGPPVPKPWDELRHLHFNDRVLFLMDR